MTDDLENLRKKYQNALAEIDKLREENALHKQSVTSPPPTSVIKPKVKVHQPASALSPINHQSPVEKKISLFRRLLSGREDVYPKRWESKNNNSGYSPVCSNEWNPAYCNKPRVKCNKCKNRQYVSLTDKVIYDHLAGKQTIGVLSAATAFGKTVVAAKLIAVRKRNTLILVHRRQLMDQWRDKLSVFLGIDPRDWPNQWQQETYYR